MQLIYHSTASELMSERSLEQLLTKSRENNKANNISGMLIYDDGSFIQVIEGSEKDLNLLLAKLYKDTRHKNFVEMNREYIEKRDFAEWSMGFRHSKDLNEEAFTSILQLSSNERLNKLMAIFHKAYALDRRLH